MASIVHVIVGLGNGGAEKTLFKLVSHDWKNTHTVISLTDAGTYGPLIRSAGGHLHCLGLRWWNFFRSIHSLRLLRCLTEADIVTAWMPRAILLSPFFVLGTKEIKLVLNFRASSYGKSYLDSVRKSALWAWSLLFGKRVVAAIVPGEKTLAEYPHLPLPREKFRVIHNGFSTEDVSGESESLPAEANTQWSISKETGAIVIGMFARWHRQKNHAGMLRAISRLSQSGVNLKLVLAGAGMEPANKKLCRLINRYDLDGKVDLLGNLQSLGEPMKNIALHVMPSTFGEAFPNSVAETMLSGIPNIVTDVGDSATIVGSTGWIIKPNNPDALYLSLKEATGARANLEQRGIASRERILRQFPMRKMIETYENLFHEVHVGNVD